jgi:hypothetical protein
MHRRGVFVPGTKGQLTWHQRAEETGAVLFGTLPDAVVLVYDYRAVSGDWEQVVVHIRVEWTPCHFGGTRPWFRCPQCDRRVGVLYDAGKWFWCRHCTGLPYASQQHGGVDRWLEPLHRLREWLSIRLSPFETLGPWHKPKGMHWRTFHRLAARDTRYRAAFLGALRRLL